MNPYPTSLFEEYLALANDPIGRQAFLARNGITTRADLIDFLDQFQAYIQQTRGDATLPGTSTTPILGGPSTGGVPIGVGVLGGSPEQNPFNPIEIIPVAPNIGGTGGGIGSPSPGGGQTGPPAGGCPQGYVFSSQLGICIKKVCQPPEIFNPLTGDCDPTPITSGICSFPQYFDTVSKTCKSCPLGQLYSSERQQCEPIVIDLCPSGQSFDTTQGRCVPIVTPCPANATRNAGTGQCECNEGFTAIEGQCLPRTNCPPNSTRNRSTGQCECNSGFSLSNGTCVPDAQPPAPTPTVTPCPDNSTRNSVGVCVCNQGFTLTNGVCVRDQVINPSPPVIQCGQNEIRDPLTQECRCAPGTQRVNGVCVQVQPIPCPANATRNASGQCVCNPGFQSINGRCLPIPIEPPTCGPDEVFSSQEGRCVSTTLPLPAPTGCPAGYVAFNVPNLKREKPLCCEYGIEPEPGVQATFRCKASPNAGGTGSKLGQGIIFNLLPEFDPELSPPPLRRRPNTMSQMYEYGTYNRNKLMFLNGQRDGSGTDNPIYSHGYPFTIVKPGVYTFSFDDVPGYITPPSQTIVLTEEDFYPGKARAIAEVSGGQMVYIREITATWRQAATPQKRSTVYTFYHAFGRLEGPFVRLIQGNGFFNGTFAGVGQYSVTLEPGQTISVSCGDVPGYITPVGITVTGGDEGIGSTPVTKEYEFRYVQEDGVVEPQGCPEGTVRGPSGQCEPQRPVIIEPPIDPGPGDEDGILIIVTEYTPDLPGIGPDRLTEGRIYINGEEKAIGSLTIKLPPGIYIIRFGDLDYHPAISYITPGAVEVEIVKGRSARVLGRYIGKYNIKSRWLHPFIPSDIMTSHLRFTKGMFSNDIENLLTYHTSSINVSLDNHYTHIYQKNPESPGAEIQFSLAYGHIEGSGSNDQGGQYNDTPTRAIYGQYRNLLIENSNGKFNLTGQETEHIYVISYQKDRRDTRADYHALEINIAHLSGSEYINGTGSMLTHTGSNVKLGGEGKVLRLISDAKINEDPTLGFGGYEYNIISGTIEDGPYNPESVHRYGKLYPSLGVVILDASKLDLSASFGTVTSRETDGKNQLKLFTALSGAAQYYDLTGNDYLGMKARATKEEIVNYYFVHVRNKMANLTNNPSYYDLETGEIYGDVDERPKTYITTIGLYDDQRQLLAVGKTSKPELKSFTDEVVYNVRLKL